MCVSKRSPSIAHPFRQRAESSRGRSKRTAAWTTQSAIGGTMPPCSIQRGGCHGWKRDGHVPWTFPHPNRVLSPLHVSTSEEPGLRLEVIKLLPKSLNLQASASTGQPGYQPRLEQLSTDHGTKNCSFHLSNNSKMPPRNAALAKASKYIKPTCPQYPSNHLLSSKSQELSMES